MDTSSGKIYEVTNDPQLTEDEQYARMLKHMSEAIQKEENRQLNPADVVPLARMPDPNCKRCNGTGSKPAGLHSRRFKPCSCTQ